MARTKLKKIESVESFPNVFNYLNNATEKELRNYFGNNNPISLEIGCGEADYTIEMARLFPNKNFVGIDFKGARIYLGAKKAIDEKIDNAAFLWINAEHLDNFFVSEKVEEIFITFPEPHIKRRTERKRLTSPRFLKIYKKFLQTNGHVHLKTDDDFLYNYTLEVLSKGNYKVLFQSADLYSEENLDTVKSIKTRYERYYLKDGRIIKYIEFLLH